VTVMKFLTQLMKMYKDGAKAKSLIGLFFKSVYEILTCDHSNVSH